ncbi:tetratricopeptide repeat protein, partial [Candidatus Woesebacteria bacterium]|nr:tetratricopeptide repeat protein [Candidatus Woesebacteria bacterium]
MARLLDNLEKYLIYLVLFWVPLAVLGVFANPFEIPKVAVLIFGVTLLLFIFSLLALFKGSATYSVFNFDLPVFLLGITYLVSGIAQTPNKMEAFLVPGTASVIFFGAFFYLLLNHRAEAKKLIAPILTLTGAIASAVTLLAYSGVLTKVTFFPIFAQSVYFNLAGGYLPQLLMLSVILPLSIGLILQEKETIKKVFYAVSTLIIVGGVALSIFNILPGQPGKPTLPPYQTSWSIAIDTLKTSPLLGVGPGNYLTAFNRLRPISSNQTDLWAVKFSTASSFALTLITEVGLLGLAVFAFLVWQVVKIFKQKENLFSLTSLALSLIALFLLPGTTTLLFLFFVLLALNAKPGDKKLNLTLATLPILLATLGIFYLAGRGFYGEYLYRNALSALVANDGRTTYETLGRTIKTNPYVDRYHASYSQVTIALARGLAQKETLTDEDKNIISQLIQQAISEAKATASLNPTRSANWEVLARTYQAIMPFAKGADQFAIQTFSQAVALDPFNPNLRIALGGVYYALGNYDEAIKVFASAVTVKNDLANAHYN